MKWIFFLLLTLFTFSATALEMDERLTLRIVGVSKSKKTMLINRGQEDGLAKGDHAKFFLSVGVVARAVVIKVSPSRSVWSVYRLVNADYIRKEQVMKLKITDAVKVTKDNSRMLVSDDSPFKPGGPRDLGIPLAEGADDLTVEQKALKITKGDKDFWETTQSDIGSKTKEIFIALNYSGFTSNAGSSNTDTISGAETNMSLLTGAEIYINNKKSWFGDFSFLALLALNHSTGTSYDGSSISESNNEFGGGVNWHPFAHHGEVNKFNLYGHFSFLMGSTSSKYTPATGTASTLSGSSTAYVFGAGLKYYSSSAVGFRVRFDYYTRGDQFAEDLNMNSYVKTKSGPRIFVGMSKRW